MSDPQLPYKTGADLMRAAKSLAKTTGPPDEISDRLRRMTYERFLARVFQDTPSPWVLKGGVAVLARVADARYTSDIDLISGLQDLDQGRRALNAAAATDLQDHFRFIPTRVQRAGGGTQQPGVDGYKLSFDAYCGTQKVSSFSVDLVRGSLMTAPVEAHTPRAAISIPGLPPPEMRLYPVVDHLADKLCATQALYGDPPRRSSRVRDLVDLVVLARTQDVAGGALIRAIAAEWAYRHLEGAPDFSPPPEWLRTYRRASQKVPACQGLTELPAAAEFIRGFLGPALDGTAEGRSWSCASLSWQG